MTINFNHSTNTISSDSGTVVVTGFGSAGSAGSVTYSQGSSGGIVSNSNVTVSSKIFLTCQSADYSSPPGSAPFVANVGTGSFRIAFPNSLSNNTTVNYFIL